MAKLWNRISSPHEKSKIEEIDPHKIDRKAPTLIFLPGVYTTNKHPHYVSGSLKLIKQLLENSSEVPSNLNVYGLSYESSLRSSFNSAAYFYNPWGKAPLYQEPRAAALSIIIHRIADNIAYDEDGKLSATLLKEDEARKNLRNLTLHGYSAGTIFMHQMYHEALGMMQQLGLPKEKSKDMLKEIVTLSVGNISHPKVEKNRFTSVCLIAQNDIITRTKDIMVNPLMTIYNRYARSLKIRHLSDSYLLVSGAVKRKLWEWVKKPDGSREKKKIPSVLLPAWSPLRSNHEYQHFLTLDDEHNAFSKMALNILVNAVNRKALLDPIDLLKPTATENFTQKEASAYIERIQKATIAKKR